ncbi:MAG: DUF2155 domain-containing protein [Rickettsiales bacterium]|jgi:hypothetical protein|nr:DUF2155 domain-containing protein [Rickettsiales bacterium]
MRKTNGLFIVLAAALLNSAPTRAEDERPPEPNSITLQGLNKVTGRTSKFDGLLGTVLRFGNLEIVARRCWKAPPEERPENAALLEISELKRGEAPAQVFLGWMFSSSPSLSGLEHPVYDISIISCDVKKKTEKEESDNSDEQNKKSAPSDDRRQ